MGQRTVDTVYGVWQAGETENTGFVKLYLTVGEHFCKKGWLERRKALFEIIQDCWKRHLRARRCEPMLQEQVNKRDFLMKSPARFAASGSSLPVKCHPGDSSSSQIAPPWEDLACRERSSLHQRGRCHRPVEEARS